MIKKMVGFGMGKQNFRAWFQVVRPPNLVTVPGDPLVGFLLAMVSVPHEGVIPLITVVPCMVASVLLYMAGLMLNDYADRGEDGMLRPSRPIPSGAVDRNAVASVGIMLLAGGVAMASIAGKQSLAIAVCLAILILLYNFMARRIRPLGSLVMGFCRGGSLLLGASAIGLNSPLVFVAALGLTFYIMEVSNIAVREAEGKLARGVRWFPALVLLLLYLIVHYRLGEVLPVSIVLSLAAFGWALARAAALGEVKSGADISRQVGLLLRGLILVQASFCALAGQPGLIAAGGLLLLWPVGILLSRKFYAS
jgi:4-hydroxybenzoate polyprenyltransferase